MINNMDISLDKYVKKHLTELDYFSVMSQLVGSIYKMQREGMKIELEASKIIIKNGKLQFSIKLEDSVYEVGAVKDFLKQLTFKCVFEPGETCDGITNFLKVIDSASDKDFYDAADKFCADYMNESGISAKEDDAAFEQVTTQATPATEANVGETGVLDANFWNKLAQSNSNQPTANETSVNNAGIKDGYGVNVSEYPATGAGETGVLDPEFWQQLNARNTSSNCKTAGCPRLIHTKTGVSINITKPEFYIGKGDNVDLKIEKDVISRVHAKVIVNRNHYFIMDNDSTNKTYVNGKVIQGKASVEIFNNTKIKFANEEYTFQL